MLPRINHSALYKYRVFPPILFLLVIIYFALHTWFTFPPIILFVGWDDTALKVVQIVEDQYDHYVDPGDTVLEIDGRPMRRGEPIFYPPIKDNYLLKIQRGENVFVQEIHIPASTVSQTWILSLGTLALAFWGIGTITVLFAKREQSNALFVGFGFQLVGAWIVSPGPINNGLAGAWIIGNFSLFFFPLFILYLGLVPLGEPLSLLSRRLLKWIFLILTIFALLAVVEIFFLFPDTSYQQLTGINTWSVLTVLAGSSLVASIIILITRAFRAINDSYEKQQLKILAVVFSLAVTPLIIFVILPAGNYIFVPFPFIYSMLLLIPIGYFFVIHRYGMLRLDILFGRLITVIMLVLATLLIYATGSYLFDLILGRNFGEIEQGGFLFVVFTVAVISQKQVQGIVDSLLYGRDELEPDSIRRVTSRISKDPSSATMTDVVQEIAASLNIHHIVVMINRGDRFDSLATTENIQPFQLGNSNCFGKMLLHTRNSDDFSRLPMWVDLSIPIVVQDDVLGLFLLTRPDHSYFNIRHIKLLKEIADILASGLQIISLVDVTQNLLEEKLYEREFQRQRIATEIHNEPLQLLGVVTDHLKNGSDDESVQETAEIIRRVTHHLRRIIFDLQPPALNRSIEWMIRDLVREFEETNDEIDVALHIDVKTVIRPPKRVKLAVYNVLVESLKNIQKHAKASSVEIKLNLDDELVLTITDNGLGGAIALLSLNNLTRGEHFGVADLHRWASISGGSLEIRANKPTGTVVDLILPAQWEDEFESSNH